MHHTKIRHPRVIPLLYEKGRPWSSEPRLSLQLLQHLVLDPCLVEGEIRGDLGIKPAINTQHSCCMLADVQA